MSSKLTCKLLRSAPYFPVSNVERSAPFYEEILGFCREYSAGTPLQLAICSRDALAIMQRKVLESDLIMPDEKQGGKVGCFLLGKRRSSSARRVRSKNRRHRVRPSHSGGISNQAICRSRLSWSCARIWASSAQRNQAKVKPQPILHSSVFNR